MPKGILKESPLFRLAQRSKLNWVPPLSIIISLIRIIYCPPARLMNSKKSCRLPTPLRRPLLATLWWIWETHSWTRSTNISCISSARKFTSSSTTPTNLLGIRAWYLTHFKVTKMFSGVPREHILLSSNTIRLSSMVARKWCPSLPSLSKRLISSVCLHVSATYLLMLLCPRVLMSSGTSN